jgi:diguanylate cyclase (GGDEF)-like protein
VVDPKCLVVALVAVLVMLAVILSMRRAARQVGERVQQLERALEERSQQLERATKQIKEIANGDPLTGVSNHRTFQDSLRLQWRRTARSRLPLTLLMIDVDGLKNFNESKGHQAGDECLRQIAGALRLQLQRPGDLVARYGGDEFAILLADTDASGGIAVAEKMRQGVEALEVTWGPDVEHQRITISVGAATTVPSPQEQPASLVAAADRALSVAKRNGRNRVEM